MFILNLIGIGLGPMLTGLFSDLIRDDLMTQGMALEAARADGLKYALCIMSVVNLWSAWHYLRAARTLREDIVRSTQSRISQ